MIQNRFGIRVAGAAFWLLLASLLGAGGSAIGQGPIPGGGPGRGALSGATSGPLPAGTSLGGGPRMPAVVPPEVVQSSGRPGDGAAGGRRLLIRLPGTEGPARGTLFDGPRVEVLPPGTARGGDLDPSVPWGDPTDDRGAAGGFVPGQYPLVAQGNAPEVLPAPQGMPSEMLPELQPGEMIVGGEPPIFGELVQDTLPHPVARPGLFARLLGPHRSPYDDRGLGHERVMMAPFEIDITQPQNNLRLRLDNAYGFEFPDRAEYFWARVGGRGPDGAFVAPFEQVNYQDIRYMFEIGGPKVSVQTELPIRFIDPQDMFYNTAGLGDMSIKTKLLMIDGRRWQVTQYFGTYLPTGAPGHGLGTGHTSLEPGFLFRYMLSDATYWHGEIKYWIPLGGDPNWSGQIFRWGTGLSTLWYESDTLAIMPTLELVSWTVMDGRKSLGFIDDDYIPVDGETTVNLYPGLRFSYDSGSDLGLFEFGIQGGFTLTETYWYSGLLRLEARFVY